MNILLLSMPDSFEHMPPIVVRMPNGALSSLAGNIDPHHRVAIADLILVQSRRRADRRAADARAPARCRRHVGDDVSAGHRLQDCPARSTPQAGDAHCGRRVRSEPGAASLRTVRRRGFPGPRRRRADVLRAAARAGSRRGFDVDRRALSCRDGRTASSTMPDRGRSRQPEIGSASPAQSRRPRPRAATRCSAARSMSSRRRGAAPTTAASARSSRCAAATFTPIRSSACSPTSPTRAATAREPSSSSTTTSRSTSGGSKRCARRLSTAGLNDIEYFVQAMTSPIAQHGATLAPLMKRAGFRYVFLGIENILESDLAFPEGAREERTARARPHASATPPSKPSSTSIATACSSSAG